MTFNLAASIHGARRPELLDEVGGKRVPARGEGGARRVLAEGGGKRVPARGEGGARRVLAEGEEEVSVPLHVVGEDLVVLPLVVHDVSSLDEELCVSPLVEEAH